MFTAYVVTVVPIYYGPIPRNDRECRALKWLPIEMVKIHMYGLYEIRMLCVSGMYEVCKKKERFKNLWKILGKS